MGVVFGTVIAAVCLLSGCASFQDVARERMEARNAVQKGQILQQVDGLYEATVPHKHMYAVFGAAGPGSVMISHRGMGAYLRGSYYVVPCPADAVTPEARESLETAFASAITDPLQKRAGVAIEVLKQEKTDWRGMPALYHEWFVPGDIRTRGNTTDIYRNNFGYAGLFVRIDPCYFWISHCDPVGQRLVEQQNTKIKQETRDAFHAFAQGITLAPEGKYGLRATPKSGMHATVTEAERQAQEYGRRGQHQLRQGNLKEAERYYRKAVAVLGKTDSTVAHATVRGHLANIVDRRGRFDEAIAIAEEGLRYNIEGGDTTGIVASYTMLGDIYRHKDDIERSNEYWRKAHKAALQTGNQRLIDGVENRLKLIEKPSQP